MEEDFDLYVLAELNYDKAKLGDIPEIWYNSKNYKLKVEIIAEALEKHVKIEDTDLYKQACSLNSFE